MGTACQTCNENTLNEKDPKNPTEITVSTYEPKDFYSEKARKIITKLGYHELPNLDEPGLVTRGPVQLE